MTSSSSSSTYTRHGLTVPGSVAAVAAQRGRPLAEALLDVRLVALVDVSASMDACDARGGRARYLVAREELTRLQAAHPGQAAVIAFASDARFVPGGVPPEPGGSTDLAGALRFSSSLAHPGVTIAVISDGEPNDEASALREAAALPVPIHAVYVGPEHDQAAQTFLRRLATAGGGGYVKTTLAAGLADALRPLLPGGGSTP